MTDGATRGWFDPPPPGGGSSGREPAARGRDSRWERRGRDAGARGEAGSRRRPLGGRGDGTGDPGDADGGAAQKDPVQSAHAAALRLLTVRAHSRAEIEQRLARRGFEAEPVATALDRLERAGLLDDEAFATELAASRTRRGYSASMVGRDLRSRGVDKSIAARAAAAASPPDEEAERCVTLARDWVARHPGLAYEVAARRLAGYLARRGYSSGVVARAVASTVERADSDIEFNPEPD